MANPHGQIVDTAHSDGLTVAQYWQWLLEENEQCYRHWCLATCTGVASVFEPMDDDDLAVQLANAFPNNTSKLLRSVSRNRAAYNRGKLRGQTGGMPVVRSWRYILDADGWHRATTRGRRIR